VHYVSMVERQSLIGPSDIDWPPPLPFFVKPAGPPPVAPSLWHGCTANDE